MICPCSRSVLSAGMSPVGATANSTSLPIAEMAPLVPYVRYLDKKLSVLDQSLAKIEASKPLFALPSRSPRSDPLTDAPRTEASYHLSIRKAEYRDKPELLAAYAKRLASDGGAPVVAVGGPE